MSAKVIAFNPILAELGGSANAGLFMSQLLYWWEAGHIEGWVFKTIEEFQKETRLTRGEQDTAIAQWTKLGILEKKLMQIPAKRFFRIDTDKLIELYKNTNSDAEIDKLDCRIAQTITENTNTEKTHKWLRKNFSSKVRKF